MEDYPMRIIEQEAELPPLLREMARPPKKLFIRGQIFSPEADEKFLCVVGARQATSYGRAACEQLIAGLADYKITIISGLAIGIDSIAHRAALKCGLKTIAVPGSSLNGPEIYPKSHYSLAKEILENGGGLISPFPPHFTGGKWSFPQRNAVMAGLAHAVLVVEAQEKSGTLITARLGLEHNREVGAVPGQIFSKNSAGPHLLIRCGAAPIRNSADLLELLGINTEGVNAKSDDNDVSRQDTDCFSQHANCIIKILNGPTERDELSIRAKLSPQDTSIALSELEMAGRITVSGSTITPNI